MKYLSIILLIILFLPSLVSAKTIEKWETKEVYFHVKDDNIGAHEIIIKLSDGSSIKLNSGNGWSQKQMVLEDTVIEECSEDGIEGSISEGEVIVDTGIKGTIQTVIKDVPKYAEVKTGPGPIIVLVTVCGLSLLGIVAAIINHSRR